jgi:hypothetical protein
MSTILNNEFGNFVIINAADGETSGNFCKIISLNDNALLKAESYEEHSLSSNGNYNSGNPVLIPFGIAITGKFKNITVSEGTILAYNYNSY